MCDGVNLAGNRTLYGDTVSSARTDSTVFGEGNTGRSSQDPLHLRRDNRRFHATGGVSRHNAAQGFRPAFYDRETGHIYLSRFADGRLAPVHLLHRLPREVVLCPEHQAFELRIKGSLIAGFVRLGEFFTRQQAAEALA